MTHFHSGIAVNSFDNTFNDIESARSFVLGELDGFLEYLRDCPMDNPVAFMNATDDIIEYTAARDDIASGPAVVGEWRIGVETYEIVKCDQVACIDELEGEWS